MTSKADSFKFSLPENLLPVHMNDCRLRKLFTDITIKVGKEEYPAHKIVLQATSPVMRTWLTDNWKREDDVYEWSEQFVDSEIVKDLLAFFYTAEVTITTENAHAFCMASHYLHISSLLEASEQFLSERVVPENVLDLFLLADQLKLEILRAQCIVCVINHYKAVLKNNRILAYSLEDLKLLIKEIDDNNEDFRVKEVLFECLMNWVENDLPARHLSLPSLLRELPLTEFSLHFLNDSVHVALQNFIPDSPIVSRLLNQAFSEAIKVSQQIQQTNKKPINLNSNSCKLYCFGGKDENGNSLSSVSCWNISTGIWNSVNSMSTTRSHFGGAIIGRKIYLCGGRNNGKTDAVEVYDCSTHTTSPLRSLPQPRINCAAAALNEFVYISGGQDSSGVTSSVLRYNTVNDQWEEVKSMHNAREDHQMVELNGRLYTIGGFMRNTVEVYDPATDQWTIMANSQRTHPWAGATVHENRIYVCSHKGFEVYSPDTNTWQILNTSTNKNDYGRTLVSMTGKLWSFGGSDNVNRGSSSVYSYDIDSGEWTQEPNMDISRGQYCSFVVPV